MMTAHTSVEQYVASPENVRFDIGVPSLMPILARMTSLWGRLTLVKWCCLRSIRNTLVRQGIFQPFSLRLKWTWKSMAYMRDEGELYLSIGFLASRSAWNVLSVYVHELSHIWLSQQEDYPLLKTLQREFRSRYGTHTLCELMSPIEIYADLLAVAILSDMERHAEKGAYKQGLLRLVQDRQDKLKRLTDELSRLDDGNEN